MVWPPTCCCGGTGSAENKPAETTPPAQVSDAKVSGQTIEGEVKEKTRS